MNSSLLSLTNVTKRFASHQAVDGVSLEVAFGDAVVILGPSGCLELTIVGDSAKAMLSVPLKEKVVVKW